MAKKDPLDRLGEQLLCAVCLDTYTNPKVLLCNHAYCKACIEQLVVRNSHSVSCPNCRKVTPIPENGVQGLQPAFRINNLMEIQGSLKRIVQGASGPASYCPDHDDEGLKLYCETCSKLICFQCVSKGAKHHKCDYERLNILCDRYAGEIVTYLEPLKGNLATIDNAMEQLAACRGEISDQHAAIQAGILNTFKQLQDALEFRQTILIDQLQRATDKKLEQLASQNDKIQEMRTHLKQCQASVEEKLQTSSEEELVTTKPVLVREIEETNSLFQPDLLRPSTAADMTFTASADVIGVCRKYGALSAGELLPDPAQCYATGPGLEAALVGEEANIFVQAVSFCGNPCDIPVQPLQCEIVSEINNSVLSISDIDSTEQMIVIKYTPAIRGWHQLHIKVSNQNIEGSPFTVRVKCKTVRTQISAIDVNKPWGIAVNHRNEIIVTEYEQHSVSVFRSSGEKLRSFGTFGSDKGQFNHPRGVAVDNEDSILVADYKNNRVQKFTADGEFLAAVGTKGSGALQFNGPKGIAFNTYNQKVYVVDENNF